MLSITRRASTDKAYTPASTKVDFGAASGATLVEAGYAQNDTDEIKFTITLDNGEKRELTVTGDTTIEDVYKNIAQAAGSGVSLKTATSGGVTSGTFSGIQKIEAEGVNGEVLDDSKLKQTNTAAAGVKGFAIDAFSFYFLDTGKFTATKRKSKSTRLSVSGAFPLNPFRLQTRRLSSGPNTRKSPPIQQPRKNF